jgi:hypothetical protein
VTDDVIKQLVLRLKVEGQDELSKVTQTLSKDMTGAGKSFPTRDMSELVKLSEKVGGEFKKVVDQLSGLRLTTLKNEIKDIDDKLKTLQSNLRGTMTSVQAQAEAMGQIGDLAKQKAGLQQEAAGLTRPGLLQRMGGPLVAGFGTAMVASQAYETFAQFNRVRAEQTNQDINARLNAVQQLMMPIQREQQLYYSGNLTRLALERQANERAREVARAQVEQERQALEARVQETTGAIGRRAAAGAGMGALGFLGGGPLGIFTTAAGAIGGGGSALIQRYQAQRQLQRFQETEQGRYAQLFTQARTQMSQEPMEPLIEAVRAQALPMTRMQQAYGGDIEQLMGVGRGVQGTAFSEQEMRQMAPGVQAQVGGYRGMEIVRSMNRLRSQGYQGDVGTMLRTLTAMSKAGGTANVANVEKLFPQTQTATGNTVYQNLINQMTAGIQERSNLALNYGGVAGQMGFIAGQAAPGEDPQRKMQALTSMMGMPDYMKTSGTMENMLYRSNIREALFKAGKRGMEASSLENWISTLDVKQLQPGSEAWDMLKSFGLNPHEILGARVKSSEQRLDTIMGKNMVNALKSGTHKRATLERAAMLETGGIGPDGQPLSTDQLLVEGRKLELELNPRRRAAPTQRPRLPSGGLGQQVHAAAEAQTTALSAPIRQGQQVLTQEGPEGDKARNIMNQAILQPAPSPTGGGFGGEIDDVKMALDAFVAAVNSATLTLGGTPPGQATVRSGAANKRGTK